MAGFAAAAVRQLRSFNRTVVERIGALEDPYLQSRHGLGEARVLWELGAGGSDLRALQARLNLDPEYLSRLLRSLESQKLIRLAGVQRARLTKAGLRERAALDRKSDALAESILNGITDDQRMALLGAVQQVDRLLTASMVGFTAENPLTPDARWCFEQYFAELNRRFDSGFDPEATIALDMSELEPPAGLLIVARLRGRAIGCGALRFHAGKTADVKRMWVAPDTRGLGVGKRLLAVLESHARAAGVRRLRLETNKSLTQAISLYRGAGYKEVAAFNAEPYAHHWFQKRLR